MRSSMIELLKDAQLDGQLVPYIFSRMMSIAVPRSFGDLLQRTDISCWTTGDVCSLQQVSEDLGTAILIIL